MEVVGVDTEGLGPATVIHQVVEVTEPFWSDLVESPQAAPTDPSFHPSLVFSALITDRRSNHSLGL